MTVNKSSDVFMTTSERQLALISQQLSAQLCSGGENEFPAIAMPGHSGLDGVIRPVLLGSATGLAKTYHYQALSPYRFDDAVAAYTRAGQLGCGPQLISADPQSETIFMEYLCDGWRTAVVTDFRDPLMSERLIKLKKQWHQQGGAAPELSAADVFGHYQAVWQALPEPLPLPLNTGISSTTLADLVTDIQHWLTTAGCDTATLHGENTVSNVLVADDQTLKLVDFDRCSRADPLWDLAALSMEICADDSDRNRLLEIYYGRTSVALLARLKLYCILDDAVWAMWALLGETDPERQGPELYKYAANRLIRIRHYLDQYDINTLSKEI